MSMNKNNIVSMTWAGVPKMLSQQPKEADIVIIGGGIIGVSTALFLAKQNIRVVLCEKGFIAGEQSGRNWGWVRVQGRDTREIPMMLESLNIWRNLSDDIGEDVGYVEGGCLYSARTQKDLKHYSEWLDVAHEYDIPTTIIDGEKLTNIAGESSKQWIAAMYTPNDGRAEPHKATPAIAKAASRFGAKILTGCTVRGIETQAGNVSSVITEHGPIKTNQVLCAAGAWTSLFCRSLGINVPQLKVRGTVARTAPVATNIYGNIFDKYIGIRRRQDGGYTIAHGSVLDHGITPSTIKYALMYIPALIKEINVLRLSIGKDFINELKTPKQWQLDEVSPFEKNRILNPEPNLKVLRSIKKNLGKTFPELKNIEIIESWAGMVETTPDVIPIISDYKKIPGFYIATGFSGHGFGIGPGAGKSIATMLMGKEQSIDLSPFKLRRFFDGSKIQPQSTI